MNETKNAIYMANFKNLFFLETDRGIYGIEKRGLGNWDYKNLLEDITNYYEDEKISILKSEYSSRTVLDREEIADDVADDLGTMVEDIFYNLDLDNELDKVLHDFIKKELETTNETDWETREDFTKEDEKKYIQFLFDSLGRLGVVAIPFKENFNYYFGTISIKESSLFECSGICYRKADEKANPEEIKTRIQRKFKELSDLTRTLEIFVYPLNTDGTLSDVIESYYSTEEEADQYFIGCYGDYKPVKMEKKTTYFKV